ncbi:MULTISPECIES: hypothetical protein [unclassified Vibrio]|uniref:hypothetical protein n=1 Tax=unclassified Vibrio TaxID=2614977 RepID=UPI001360D01A|nr:MULTISPECIES: hypothetical protein [unclassified Vibrio]NAW60115.1 hypothetical protein [Vibrio sp. V36_P2S2PM302]NAX22472.1 hypothetical protein [Vibrio sp. V39_P1S14PM300]NAX26720.1 hypothetical protein [Vibrio sp. V38_P2S17PM301]NAX29292.1 hypothetical protein [Vibrio sp. V37_P2S8PM304]
MAATIDTQYGKVTTSEPYFSRQLLCQVRNLTLVKPENESNGWGISRECPAEITITPEFLNMFARDAAAIM